MNKNTTVSNKEWETIIKRFPEANILQSPAYAKMNEILGAKVIVESFGGAGRALLIVRDAKRGRYLELPCGPLINWKDSKKVKEVFERIVEIAKQEKCVFLRMRPQLDATAENLKTMKELGFRPAPMHLAAEHTVMIDLTQSEETLLSKMRRQTRYEVRRASKFGIEVTKDNSEEIFREFHRVQLATAKRQGFVPPDLKTLLAEREAFGDDACIYVARTAKEEESKPIAYGLILKSGLEGDYYEAASTELNRKLPGAYALLWQAMCDLKKDGYKRFNLWGIAPAHQPEHRYARVTTFKTGFGGEVVEYVPAQDLVISRLGYLKNLMVEKARKKRRHL